MRLFIIDARVFLILGLNSMKNQRFENEADGQEAAGAGGGGRGGARARAEEWLKRGQLCEAAGTAEGRREALRCQESALAAAAEIAGSPDAVLLARIWMNRGNALLGLAVSGAEAGAAREAVRSYDEALGLLGEAGKGTQETAERGMMAGAAWLNLAAAVQAAGGDGAWREAGICLERAIARLTPLAAEYVPARRNLAGAWMNRAECLRAGGDGAGAQRAWRRLAEVAACEAGRDATMLELTLRARHALCVALGEELAAVGSKAPKTIAQTSLEIEAERQVEAGLAEFAAWCGAAEGSRVTAARLFEFGAWLHRERRPERLAEFLARHADPADARRAEIARIAIHLARQEILRTDFSELVAEAGAARRGLLTALSAVEARLGEAGRPD